jgi:hypothetical protein
MTELIEKFITLQSQYYSKMQLHDGGDNEKNDGLICPITGDEINFDNAG